MIPKELHFMWLPSLDEAPSGARDNPVKWGDMNPDYKVKIWSQEELRSLIGDCYPEYLTIWEDLDKPVKQADLARMLVIHCFGGVYLDMDLEPMTALTPFFENGCIYNRNLKLTKVLPEVPSEDYIDKHSYSTILSREHCAIDNVGVGVANGIILSEPGVDWMMEFLELQKFSFNGLVLDYVGTWALTRFIRSRVKELKENGLLMLPPHYFLWEHRFFECEPPDYTICVHPAENSWGDHTKHNWWQT